MLLSCYQGFMVWWQEEWTGLISGLGQCWWYCRTIWITARIYLVFYLWRIQLPDRHNKTKGKWVLNIEKGNSCGKIRLSLLKEAGTASTAWIKHCWSWWFIFGAEYSPTSFSWICHAYMCNTKLEGVLELAISILILFLNPFLHKLGKR